MKLRKGFVSNSSSSSFTCDVCGNTESGWDLCMSEAEMCECVNGHIFCESHLDSITLSDDEHEDRYEMPESSCPICMFKNLTDSSAKRYLLKKLNLTEEQILDEIRDKFDSYEEFCKYIK